MSFIGSKRFPRQLQLDNWSCGSRSVQATLGFFGVTRHHSDLKSQLKTCPTNGTSINSIIRVLRRYGCTVAYRPHLSWHGLVHALNGGAVVIVHLDGDHLGVVHGVDDTHVHLADPSIIRLPGRRQTRLKFLARWTRWGLVVRRSGTNTLRRS